MEWFVDEYIDGEDKYLTPDRYPIEWEEQDVEYSNYEVIDEV